MIERTLFIFGILVIIVAFLGIPHEVRVGLLVFLGLVAIIVAQVKMINTSKNFDKEK